MVFDLDLIVRNGIVVTASDQVACDIGIKNGKVVLLAQGIPAQEGCQDIDAEGGYVTPGGVDRYDIRMRNKAYRSLKHMLHSHVHLAQSAAAKSFGARSADDWTSGTRSALAGKHTLLQWAHLF